MTPAERGHGDLCGHSYAASAPSGVWGIFAAATAATPKRTIRCSSGNRPIDAAPARMLQPASNFPEVRPMSYNTICRARRLLLSLLLVMLARRGGRARNPSPPRSPSSSSQLLESSKLDSIAAADPTTGRLSPPCTSPGPSCWSSPASSPRPVGADERIKNKQYRDLYMDLQGAALAGHARLCIGCQLRRPHNQEQRRRRRRFVGLRQQEPDVRGAQEGEDERDGLRQGVFRRGRAVRRILTLLLAQAKPKT